MAVAALAVAARDPHPDSPEGVLLRYLRSVPGIANEAREIQAVKLVEELLADGLGVERALGVAALRHGVHPQTVRRWRARPASVAS